MSDRKLKGFVEVKDHFGRKRAFMAAEIASFWEHDGECMFALRSSGPNDYWEYPGTFDDLKSKIAEAQE